MSSIPNHLVGGEVKLIYGLPKANQSYPIRFALFLNATAILLHLISPHSSWPVLSADVAFFLWILSRWLGGLWNFVAWSWLVGHVLVVFAVIHDWSHSAAYQETEARSGVGWGVFVNYAVILVWAAELAFRKPSLSLIVHLFVGFIYFNATVIYGQFFGQLLGIIGFTLLLTCWGFAIWRHMLSHVELDEIGPNN
jgi:hypothetical protein